MKIFSIIFSIYLLALSCLPCGDTDDCKELEKEKISFSTTDHSEHEKDTETCSPFCTCACCGVSVSLDFQFILKITEQNPIILAQKVKLFPQNESFVSDFNGNIWQPPKV